MINVWRRLLGVGVAAALSATCGGKSSPISPTTQNSWALSGTVTAAAGGAIAGATAKIIDGPNANQTATTNATGRYAFTPVLQGTFQLQITADGFTGQTATVPLTRDTSVDFALAKMLRASLSAEGGATATALADGTFDYALTGRNVGDACALQIAGMTTLADVNSLVLGRFNWTLPAGTTVAPGQAFTYHVTPVSSAAAAAAAQYVTSFTFSSATTASCPG